MIYSVKIYLLLCPLLAKCRLNTLELSIYDQFVLYSTTCFLTS